MGTAIKHPVPGQVKPSFCNFSHPDTLTLRAERQSVRMSKITNDGLTWISVIIMTRFGAWFKGIFWSAVHGLHY